MFIHYAKANNHCLSSFDNKEHAILRPGYNEFPSHIWKMYESHPDIIKMIEDGVISLSSAQVKVKEGKKTVIKILGKVDDEVHLNQVTDEKVALDIVKKTFNKALLSRWSDEETRSKIKRAIHTQLNPDEDKKTG